MSLKSGVCLGIIVARTEPWDLLALTVEGASVTGVQQAVTTNEFIVRVPEELVSPRMAVSCLVQSSSGTVMSATLFGWSSVAIDDPQTTQDERWRKIDGPESSSERIQLSGTFRP